MYKINYKGLINNPFFVVGEAKEFKKLNSDEKISKLSEIINEVTMQYPKSHTFSSYFRILKQCEDEDWYMDFYKDKALRDKILEDIGKLILKYFADEDLIKYFLNEEEASKAKSLIKKNNFKYKPIQALSNIIDHIIDLLKNEEYLAIFFLKDIRQIVKEEQNNLILATYGCLKKKLDSICSGVANEVYFNLQFTDRILKPEISKYILNKHGYDFLSSINDYLWSYTVDEYSYDGMNILEKYLFGDVKESFYSRICALLNKVLEYNDMKHVEKIIDYCFNEFIKEENGKLIYDNKLPLVFVNSFNEHILNECQRWLYNRLFKINNSNISKADFEGLLYPLVSVKLEKIEEGKIILEAFLKESYESDASRVIEILSDTTNVLQYEDGKSKKVIVREFMNGNLFGYDSNSEEERFLNILHKGFSDNQNTLNRFYYLIYLVNKYIPNNVNSAIYEYVFDVCRMIDKTYKLNCKYSVNLEMRDENYNNLKDILKKYDIIVKDSFRERYIISLLDRKYATINETSQFPVLEMKGDAIYNFAIANILFYNPNCNDNSYTKYENLISAESQQIVAKKIGLDKLYISNLVSSFSEKYDVLDEGYANFRGNSRNYIADSLEMIIGAICEEFGLSKALEFAQRIITDSIEELEMPKRVNFDDAFKSNFDREYLTKIFPCLFNSQMEDNYDDYSNLKGALVKLSLVIALDTVEKQKRNYITKNLWCYGSSDSFEEVLNAVGYYLYHDIEATIDFLKDDIVEKYNKSINE